MLDLWSGRIDPAGEQARRVVQIASELEYAVWHASGLIVEGVTVAALGRPRRGPRADRPGPRALREPPHAADLLAAGPRPPGTGARARRPGGGSARRGRGGDARRRPGRHVRPHRAAHRPGRPPARVGRPWRAEASLEDALAKARSIDRARTPELVAALRLAQLDGESPERRAAVQAVYDTFTEGFETPALQDARALVAGAGTSTTLR